MSRSNYNKDIHNMYVEECDKNIKLTKENKDLKLEVKILKYELNKAEKNNESQTELQKENKELKEENKELKEENVELRDDLSKANEEIKRLKDELNSREKQEEKDSYTIDKLNNQINKNSTNSSIPTSKEMKHNKKTGVNTYNHRKNSQAKNGGQFNHKGCTLTKEQIEEKIKQNNLEVREVKHYIKGNKKQENIVKYRVGVETKTYVEKHIFISDPNSEETLPKDFYSDVSYNNSIRTLVIFLGNYCSMPYNKIKELLSDLTNNIINLSEGTIDNIYENFSNKLDDTLNNIITNLINGTYQHTDEITTKENGKDAYYRGYANKKNVIYMYHHNKGDKPIKEDNIITNFFGTIISDHETAIFKYGTSNQDCIIHFGRYCIEKEQNVPNISWPMQLYRLLLKFEMNRKILEKFGKKEFSKSEIELMEQEYDSILVTANNQNEEITSTYWKEKCNTLLNRCIKHKETMLFYIHDFSIDYDNNFMERALRMIKSKTKVSGGFRSEKGAIRFGRIMSVIKTAKLRKMNPFNAIEDIINGESLFAST